ncbi:MAG: hypothetical protein ACYCS8_07820 [Acidithiobacillus sp.]
MTTTAFIGMGAVVLYGLVFALGIAALHGRKAHGEDKSRHAY